MGVVTHGDVGFAIIILTILVKLILFPLSKKGIKSQILMKKLEPMVAKIKKDYPDKEEQAKKTFELYKQYGTNPFSGCVAIIIQLPIIIALYYAFRQGLGFDPSLLYSFVHLPANIHTMFLGIIDVHSKSIPLALIAGVSQFIQGYLATPLQPKGIKSDAPKSFQEQMADSMALNVKYILPILITFIAWEISAAVAIYWITNNICTIIQEWYVRKTLVSPTLIDTL